MCKIDLDNRVARYGDEWSTVHCFLQPICNGSTQEWICIRLSDSCFFPKVDGWPCAHRARAGSRKVPTLLFEGFTVFSLYHCITWLFWCWFWWGHGRCRVKNACLFLTCKSEFNRGEEFSEFSFVCASQPFLIISMSPHIDYSVCASIPSWHVFFHSSESCITFAQEAHRCCTSRLQGGLPVPGDMHGTRKWSCISMAGGTRTSTVTCDA